MVFPCGRNALPILAALAFISAAAGCARHAATAAAVRRDIQGRLILEGKVTAPPTAEAEVTPPYDAPVGKIYVTVGQSVRKGEVILELSTPKTQRFYEQSRENLRRAEIAYSDARKRYLGALSEARNRLELARKEERAARKAAQPIVTGPDAVVDVPGDAAADLADAITRRKEAEQSVMDLKTEMDAMLIPYKHALDDARRQFQAAEKGRRAAQIHSPISGTVLAINTSVGRIAKLGGKPLVRIVNLGALEVHAPINERDVDTLKPGLRAAMAISGVQGVEFAGVLRRIYVEKLGFLHGSRHVAVVDFRNFGGLAKPAMNATVTVRTGAAAGR